MNLTNLQLEPAFTLSYRNAASGGGVFRAELPVLFGTVDPLPSGVDAVLATGDLQGRVGPDLLGVALCDALARRAGAGGIPPLDRIGVVLAGDLYAAPGADVRGATGPVDPVWEAFACAARWVVGVLGNHDEVDPRRIRRLQRAHLLDDASATVDGITIAGLSGIVGNPRRPNRRTEPDFEAALTALCDREPDVVVLHESPTGGPGQRGRDEVRRAVEGRVPLVISGHVHWSEPLAELAPPTLALNVDGRAVLLRRAG